MDDPTFWSVIIGAVFLGLARLLEMCLNYQRGKDTARKVQAVADKADIVANKLETHQEATTDDLLTLKAGQKEIKDAQESVHTLVNGAMEFQLRATAEAKRHLADETPTGNPLRPGRIADAVAAERALADHLSTKAEMQADEKIIPRPSTWNRP